MSEIRLDPMSSAAQWSALQLGGNNPSDAIGVSVLQIPDWRKRPVTRLAVTGSAGATGHRVQKTIPVASLTSVDEIRFWARSDRKADGSPQAVHFLRLRLASTALPFDDAANTWNRFMPFSGGNRWDLFTARCSDMPATLRSGVTGIRFECLEAGAGFFCVFDEILAIREDIAQDSLEALRRQFDGKAQLNNTPVPAVAYSPDAPVPNLPHFRVTLMGIEPSPVRDGSPPVRTDFTEAGYELRPPRIPYDMYFCVDGHATAGADRALLLDAILEAIDSGIFLRVNGEEWPAELTPSGAAFDQRFPFRFRVRGWRSLRRAPDSAKPVREVVLEAEEGALRT